MNNHQKIEVIQKEFLYRHKQYWTILFNFFLVDISILLIPFVSEVFGIKIDPNSYKYLKSYTPLFASLVSQIMFIIVDSEAKRINWVNSVYANLTDKAGLFKDATKIKPEAKITTYTRVFIFGILNLTAIIEYWLFSNITNIPLRILVITGTNVLIIFYILDLIKYYLFERGK